MELSHLCLVYYWLWGVAATLDGVGPMAGLRMQDMSRPL